MLKKKKVIDSWHFLYIKNFGNNILDSVESQGVLSIFTPYRLVSLLDMLEFPIKEFFSAIDKFSVIATTIKSDESQINNEIIPNDKKHIVKGILSFLKTSCEYAGFQLSAIQIKRLLIILDKEVSLSREFVYEYEDFKKRLSDELTNFLFMVLPSDKLDYYKKPQCFSENVFNNFSKANFDIEEAGNCFAMSRFTACVMHLQRVIEVGLQSYWKLLGVTITTPQPSWNTVLDKTAKEIKDRNDKNNTTDNWTSNEEKDFCEGVQPFLVAVKTAWRNPSMHAGTKYTEEEAKEIFNAVKSFMRNLAEHLNEKGKFTKKKKK